MKKENVLITGASSGIGLELARQFAEHGHPLVLTAPGENELLAIARELAVPGVAPNSPLQTIAILTASPLSIKEASKATGLPIYLRQDLAQPRIALRILAATKTGTGSPHAAGAAGDHAEQREDRTDEVLSISSERPISEMEIYP